MRRALSSFLLGLMFQVVSCTPSFATQRVALVIGNANYQQQDKLRNPRSDAELIAQVLRTAGFNVVDTVTDGDQLSLLTALGKFKVHASSAELAVIYFSGHGMKHAGERQNYVLPIDMPSLSVNAALDADIVLKSRAISEGALLAAMGEAKLQLLILDACRDNGEAGSKSGSKGLTRRAGVGAGRLIAYATEENRIAKDGAGRYSPYAESLAKFLGDSRLSIVQALDATAEEVRQTTANTQQPTKSGDLAWDIRLDLGRAERVVPALPQPVAPNPEAVAWGMASRANTEAGFRAYLNAFPAGLNRDAAQAAILKLSASSGDGLASLRLTSLPLRIKNESSDVFAMSVDGNTAVSAHPLKRRDPTDTRKLDVLLHDSNGTELARLVAAENSIVSLDFSPDGKWLAAVDYNKNCRIWDVRKYVLLRTVERAAACRWHANSSDRLLISGRFGGIALHEVSSGRTTLWQRAKDHYLRHVAQDGLAVTEKDEKLWFWRGGENVAPSRLDLPKDAFVVFGRRHLYVGTDTEIKLFDFATLKLKNSFQHGLQTHGDFASFSLRPSPDDEYLALFMTIGSRTQMRIWQVEGWKLLSRMDRLRQSVYVGKSAWSGDSRYFAFNVGYDETGNGPPRVGVLDVRNRAIGYASGVFSASPIFLSDGRTIRSPSSEYRLD